ncbi:hypothetical protein EON77_21615, partial [bacterium]
MVLPFQGRTERRLALVILLTSILPLVAALLVASSLFEQASSIWLNPEIGRELDRGLAIYKDYVKAVKDDMRHQTDALAADEVLREAARKQNPELVEAELDTLFPRFPELVSLRIEGPDGRVVAERDRGRPVDEKTERSLDVRRPLGGASGGASDDDGTSPVVVATFAVDRGKLDQLETSSGTIAKYHQLEASRSDLYEGYLRAYAALLGLTVLITVALGSILARGVTRRIE